MSGDEERRRLERDARDDPEARDRLAQIDTRYVEPYVAVRLGKANDGPDGELIWHLVGRLTASGERHLRLGGFLYDQPTRRSLCGYMTALSLVRVFEGRAPTFDGEFTTAYPLPPEDQRRSSVYCLVRPYPHPERGNAGSRWRLCARCRALYRRGGWPGSSATLTPTAATTREGSRA